MIVSTNTPDTSAGEYADTLLDNAGCGLGGLGERRPGLVDFAGVDDITVLDDAPVLLDDFDDAGCFPFDVGVDDDLLVG